MALHSQLANQIPPEMGNFLDFPFLGSNTSTKQNGRCARTLHTFLLQLYSRWGRSRLNSCSLRSNSPTHNYIGQYPFLRAI